MQGEEEGEAQDEEGMLEVLEKEKDEEKLTREQLSRKVHVELSECVISKSELLAHFSNNGEVEDLLMPPNDDYLAKVVFKTASSAMHYLNLELESFQKLLKTGDQISLDRLKDVSVVNTFI